MNHPRSCSYHGFFKGSLLLLLLFLPHSLSSAVRTQKGVEVPSLEVPLAIQLAGTLYMDFSIRLSNDGFSFLARQLQWLLLGWVKRGTATTNDPNLGTNFYNAIPSVLGNTLIGTRSYDNSITPLCIFILNTNDDDQDGDACTCPSATTQGDTRRSNWNTDDCNRCWFGNTNNTTKTAPWGTNPDLSGCATGTGLGARLALAKDPAKPEDPTDYYWCKGPYYDTPFTYDNFLVDPDCLRRNFYQAPTADDPCPQIRGCASCANLPCANDDTATQSWCDPNVAANNSLIVTLVNDTANQRLTATIRFNNIRLDAWISYDAICECCLWATASPGSTAQYSTIINPTTLDIVATAQFVNGYYKMRGKDGVVSSSTTSGSTTSSGSTSTSSSSGSKGSCQSGSTTSGSTTSGSTTSGSTTSGSPLLNHHPLVGVEMNVASTTLGSLGIADGYSQCYDQGWLCGGVCTLAGGIIDLIAPLLKGTVEGVIRGLLQNEIEPLINEELGLPMDFVMLLTGTGSGSWKDLCALRLPSGHPLGLTCSHTTGDCPCDDYDNDGYLNYQDATPGITPTGCAAGTWCGAWTDSLEMYYSWWWGLGNGLGGYRGSEPPFYEVGAYVDDFWDTRGLNLVVDMAVVPYKTPNAGSTLSGHSRQGYYPDPQASGGQGQFWSTAFPQRSCYPLSALYLDPTQRDNDLSTFVQGPPSSTDTWISSFQAYLNDFDYQVNKGGRQNHFGFIISQEFLQQWFSALYSSGLLCIDLTVDQFPFLESMLKVSSMKALIPLLGDTDASGNPLWKQDGYVGLRFVPSDVPIVRVLGNRTGCFPSGDEIAPANILNMHSQLQLHTPVGSCTTPPAPTTNNVYDLLVYFPHFKIAVTAPDASNTIRTLFRMDWDLALALAVEYTTGSRNTPWESNVPRFFEILMDAFLGCGGQLFNTGVGGDGNWSGFNITWYGTPTCGIEIADVPAPTLTKGIGGAIHSLINTAFSLVLKTKIFLGGLNIDFYKVGVGNPIEGGSPTASQLDADCANFGATDYGCGNPDYLALAGEFVGTIDFSALFSLLGGGLSLAPGMPVVAETYVGFPEEVRMRLGGKGNLTSGRIELSPRESYLAGFGRGALVNLDAMMTFLPKEEILEKMRFTWRLDGGVWHAYRYGDTWVEPPDLLDGRHSLEVRAKGIADVGDLTPAEVIFYVDHAPPELRVYSEEGEFLKDGGIVRSSALKVEAEDNVSSRDALELEYRVDGGSWNPVRRQRIELSPYGEGLHRVELRARDEFNLTRELALEVVVPHPASTRWGCGLAQGGEGLFGTLSLLFLLLVALPLLRKRGLSCERGS